MNNANRNRVFSRIQFLFILCLLINYLQATTTKQLLTDNDDDKRVFDRNFGDNKNFLIDDCIPLAFGDFNADKIVDIFCRNTQGNQLRVMLNDDRSPTSKEQVRVNISGTIHDILAADFDGDSRLDLFVLYQSSGNNGFFNGGFLWGNRSALSELKQVSYYFQTIPTTLDANGDSLVDLLGMISSDGVTFHPACLIFANREVKSFRILNNVDNLRPNATQATVDLNGDLVADLFLTIDSNQSSKFRIYQLPISEMSFIRDYDPPDGTVLYHLSTFADIDADGELEHILPVCTTIDCSTSQIWVRDDDKWHLLPINFGEGVRFPLIEKFPSPFNRIPLSIKISDYNLDGYPDMVVIMNQSLSNSTVSMLLRNTACGSNNNLVCTYNRTFTPQTDELNVLSVTNVTVSAFFDILENGYPDLLVVQKNTDGNYQLIGFQNTLVQDVHFIKVMVLSQFSCDSCSHERRLPYGNDQPGQLVKMETITIIDGLSDNWIQLAATQMSQSGQLTLELPYVIIGLGATPNFVEKLTVAVPPNTASNKLTHTYTQMIPNSQLVVVPYPLDDPSRWLIKLFITPSRMILHAGIALGATLVVLAGLLAILQYREKIEDDKERKVQSQRFHYDAL